MVGTTLDGTLVYQINEAQLCRDGQAVNKFLNGNSSQPVSTVTPWIWTVIQFDASGKTRIWTQGAPNGNLQIFQRRT
jgi:hypothetical protein